MGKIFKESALSLAQLKKTDVVIGTVLDRGYYLRGMNKPTKLFENKKRSSDSFDLK